MTGDTEYILIYLLAVGKPLRRTVWSGFRDAK
jgi:hypothetical protein